jgi:hypothetical protein
VPATVTPAIFCILLAAQVWKSIVGFDKLLFFLMFLSVLDRQDIDIMDTLCAQTRMELAEDQNAMEFFNTFSSKENVAKCDDMKRQIREGYEPGGHRISALRSSLATAGELLAIAFSNSFFTHTSRTKIGNFKILLQF